MPIHDDYEFPDEPPSRDGKTPKQLHAERRQLAYEYYIRRMPIGEIAEKVGVSYRQTQRYIKEQQVIRQEAARRAGSREEQLQDYVDAQNAVVLKGWSILENPKLALSSQNVAAILGHISQAEERKAKAMGLLVDRSKSEVEVKMSILDLVNEAKKHKK